MGIFKSIKDMKEMAASAPAMISEAQQMQVNAAQMQAAMQQQAQAQAAAFATPGAAAGVPSAVPSDLLAPVAGVTVEQYVAVVKAVAAYNYDQAMLPSLAAGHGIGAAAWAEASAVFNGRVTSSPAFAQHFNTLYRAG